MNQPEVVVVRDPAAGAVEAARRVVTALAGAVDGRGRADWATTGGSTPVAIYRQITDTSLRDEVAWDAVHVWWGDDRFVPRDHPSSNVKPFEDVLLDIGELRAGTAAGAHRGVPLPAENVHPFKTTEAIGRAAGAAWCAAALADELRAAGLPEEDGWPAFDLMLLGIGPDGHLLSVFPGSSALESTELALDIPAPTHVEPHVERVTLNPAVIRVARRVIVVVQGNEKAEIISDVLGPEMDVRRWPAQLARGDNAVWILDEPAASRLRPR
jgi:6-phosphogluconolactonase